MREGESRLKKIVFRILIVLLAVIAAAALYTFAFPMDGRVRAFHAPALEGYTDDFAENSALAGLSFLSLDGGSCPETVLYRDGYLYSSTHGRLLRTAEDGSGTELLFDSKEGETLGFDFDADGNIVFCDPRFGGSTPGIYRVDLSGAAVTVTALCTEVEGERLNCPDALAVAEDGIIYFSDATEFRPLDYGDADYAFQYEAYYHSSNGRVCAFNPESGESWVVAAGFSGANGIAVSYDQRFLYLCETMEYCIWRIPVGSRHATKGNGAELFLSNLPGCVDNLSRGRDGRYWVGLVSARDPSWDGMLGSTFLRTILLRYSAPAEVSMPERGTAAAFAFDDAGEIRSFLMDGDAECHHVTGVCETEDRLYLHSNSRVGGIAYLEKEALPEGSVR